MTPAEMKHIMTHRASALRREAWLEEIIELLRIDADGDAYQAIEDSETNDGREVICLDSTGRTKSPPKSLKRQNSSSIHRMISLDEINNPISFTTPMAPMPIVGTLDSLIPQEETEHVQEASIKRSF